MRLALAATCAAGCLSTPGQTPSCSLRMLDELVVPGARALSPWLSPDHDDIYFVTDFPDNNVSHASRPSPGVKFGMALPIDEVTLPNHDAQSITLSLDQLEIWIVASDGSLFYATRSSRAAAFSGLAQIGGVGTLSLTRDELVAFYTRGDGLPRIATRSSRSAMFDFGGFDGIPGFPETTFQAYACATDPAGATVYCEVSSSAEPTHRLIEGKNDQAQYTPDSFYTFTDLAMQLAPEANADDYDPMIDADGRTLLFASDRSPAPTDAQDNLWIYCE